MNQIENDEKGEEYRKMWTDDGTLSVPIQPIIVKP